MQIFQNVTEPMISVIIPVYKVEAYIRQALDSIIGQTYENLQIILVDDGSPDNSGGICDEYAVKDRRIIAVHKENGGVSSARNVGIDMAKGEWLYFMDPDDWIEPETLSVCVSKAVQTGVELIMFKMDSFQSGVKYNLHWTDEIDAEGERIYRNLEDYDVFRKYRSTGGSLCNLFLRRDVLNEKIRFDTECIVDEDTLFKDSLYTRITSFLYLPKVFFHYRVREHSATRQTDYIRMLGAFELARKKILHLYEEREYPPQAEKLVNAKFLNSIISRMTGILMMNMGMENTEKRKMVLETVYSEDFIEASRCYDPEMLGMSTRMFLRLQHFPVQAVCLIYWMKLCKEHMKNLKIKGMLFFETIRSIPQKKGGG